jgi:hypothetical protein
MHLPRKQDMSALPGVFDGVVHGKTIELAKEPGLPDGQAVSVIVKPVEPGATHLPPGEGLRRAFGSWADDAEELDKFLAETRQLRKRHRPA